MVACAEPTGAGWWGRLLGPLALLACLLVTGCAARTEMIGPVRQVPSLAEGALVTTDGANLPLRHWRPEGPVRAVIVALHGFNDYSNAFDAPARDWAAQGIATLAYDQRGFGAAPGRGLWPGINTLQADLLSAVAAARQTYPGLPVFVLGESMGGAVAATTFAGAPLPDGVGGLILSAPAVWSRATMPFYQRWALAVGGWLFPDMALTPPKGLKIQASDNIEMLRALGRDPMMIRATRIDAMRGLTDLMDQAMASMARLPSPTLVLYGRNEQVIPPLAVTTALHRIPSGEGVRVLRYPDGWHLLLRDLKADIVRGDVAAFVTDPGGPLPSGLRITPVSMVES
ncbi:alpha/beta hydrolase [Niveispirillum irakense]|uniref:alpha/beta hydrolase n=1 Tax=Niveispirillum irakense TaxID=34011 RepID=UPI000411B766|nr:alpha/beta hydrolase [Niveispirillum irakense]